MLKIYESIWCFIAQLLVFLWFAYSVNQNGLMWPKMFCMSIIVILFFSQNLSNVVTVKHFVLVIFIIISDTCPRITLRWYKTILNQVEWTCKVKNKINHFWRSHTTAHLNEFCWVNNHMLETADICSRCAMYHIFLFLHG